MAFDFERDWSGEVRTDPADGNVYVLRSVDGHAPDDWWVTVNDIMGGHSRRMTLLTWVGWEKA